MITSYIPKVGNEDHPSFYVPLPANRLHLLALGDMPREDVPSVRQLAHIWVHNA